MRRTLAAFVPIAAVTVSGLALAEGKCPPGSWFCADVSVGAPPGEKREEIHKVDEAPPPAAPDTKKKAVDAETKKIDGSKGAAVEVPPSSGSTTIIINTAPPPPERHRAPPPEPPSRPARIMPPPPPRYSPPPPRRVHRSEWGFNVRLEGAMLGQKRRDVTSGERGAHPDASMGGIGFGLRARPVSHFALQLDLDFIGGRDYNGFRRQEVPFSVNALVFVNPRSKVQFYFVGGLGWSSAEVETQPGITEQWSYFGLQGGAGLEWRVSRAVGLGVDVIGFIRGRTDDGARNRPEFVDPATGRATNTSGGGLLRLGSTFYWLRPRTAAIASFSEPSL